MYIRRKVFSVVRDENTGEERYFSVTEIQKEFGNKANKILKNKWLRQEALKKAGKPQHISSGFKTVANQPTREEIQTARNAIIEHKTPVDLKNSVHARINARGAEQFPTDPNFRGDAKAILKDRNSKKAKKILNKYGLDASKVESNQVIREGLDHGTPENIKYANRDIKRALMNKIS